MEANNIRSKEVLHCILDGLKIAAIIATPPLLVRHSKFNSICNSIAAPLIESTHIYGYYAAKYDIMIIWKYCLP